MSLIPGWLWLLGLSSVSLFLSQLVVMGGKHPLEASALAILLGILVKALGWVHESAKAGIGWSEKFLAFGIVLMGAGLNFHSVAGQGAYVLWVILVTMLAGFGLIYALGRVFGLPGSLSLLLAIGTTICGTTAIAIIAPLMKSIEEETAYAVGTVALCGLLAILIYPALGHYWGMNDFTFGVFAGTAIHSTPQVVGAGFMYSDLAGQTATAVKLVRNCFIAPLALAIAFYYNRGSVSLVRVFPWFLFGYFVMAWAQTAGLFPVALSFWLGEAGKFLILLGMAGIGLSAELGAFKRVGLKPLGVGILGSFLVASVSMSMIYYLAL